jgi:hypothetical protein
MHVLIPQIGQTLKVVLIMNSLLMRYGLHLSIAIISAKNSFSYIDKNLLLVPKGLLRKAMGLSPWISTAPRPHPRAIVHHEEALK